MSYIQAKITWNHVIFLSELAIQKVFRYNLL